MFKRQKPHYQSTDPAGWNIVNCEGRVIEKGFSSFTLAQKRIGRMAVELRRLTGIRIDVAKLYFAVRA